MICRSLSSFVSPGPRVPMPPPRRDICFPRPVRRGRRYSSCASSTWIRPSRDRACRAKMSRMTPDRSMTGTLVASSSLRCCAGESSSSATTMSARRRATSRAISSALPFPTQELRSGVRRCWIAWPATVPPAAATSAPSSSSESSASNRESGTSSATRYARSGGVSVSITPRLPRSRRADPRPSGHTSG